MTTVYTSYSRGFRHAREDVQPEARYVVYAGTDRFPMANGIEVLSLVDLYQRLSIAHE